MNCAWPAGGGRIASPGRWGWPARRSNGCWVGFFGHAIAWFGDQGSHHAEVMTEDALNYPASPLPVDNVCVKDTWADEARGERAEGYSTAGRDRIPPGPP